MNTAKASWVGWLAVAVLASSSAVGCDEPNCPQGYRKEGDTCYRVKDAGTDAAQANWPDLEDAASSSLPPERGSSDGGNGALDSGGELDDGGQAPSHDAGEIEAMLDASSPLAPNADSSATSSVVDTGVPSSSNDASPTDPCASASCQNGGTCSVDAGSRVCSCLDGYTGTNCELEICGDTPIRSRADVENNRLCAEIRGNLDLTATGLTSITADDFPFLTKITGGLTIIGRHTSGGTNLESVTLSKLAVVEGAVSVASNLLIANVMAEGTGPLAELHLPALTTIEGGLVVSQTTLRVLDLPALTTIREGVTMYFAPELCTLNVRRVSRVEGDVRITGVQRLSSQLFAPLRNASTGMVVQSMVGCCWTGLNERVSCTEFLTGCSGCRTQ
jgi:hypothetical protein